MFTDNINDRTDGLEYLNEKYVMLCKRSHFVVTLEWGGGGSEHFGYLDYFTYPMSPSLGIAAKVVNKCMK